MSAERTVSWMSEYYGRSRRRVGRVYRERERNVRRGGALAICVAFRSCGGGFSALGHRRCGSSVNPSQSCTEVRYAFKIQLKRTSHAQCEQCLRLSAAVDPAACAGSKPKVNYIDEIYFACVHKSELAAGRTRGVRAGMRTKVDDVEHLACAVLSDAGEHRTIRTRRHA